MNESNAIIYLLVSLFAFLIVNKMRKNKVKQFVGRIQSMSPDQKRLEIEKQKIELDKYKTSHLLHFFITFLSFGLWVFVWIFIAQSNAGKRAAVEKLIKEI